MSCLWYIGKPNGQKSPFSLPIYPLFVQARYYDPQLGQFLSPDTLVPDATNLMDYNRYAYARGNPMKYNNPTGHCVLAPPVDTIACILLGAALILGGDSSNTTYVPTKADISSSKIGGALILAGGGDLAAQALGTTARTVVVGATVNASMDVAANVVQNKTVSPTEVGITAGYGAVTGGAASLPLGWSVAISALAGGAQQFTTATVVDQQSPGQAFNVNPGIAAGLGGIGAFAQGSLPTALRYPSSEGPIRNVLIGKEAEAYGGAQFARNTGINLYNDQVSYLGGFRYIPGYLIASLPISVAPSVQYVEPVSGPR